MTAGKEKKMEWYKAQSLEKPGETDTTSSSFYNYARRNIEEEIVQEEDGTEHTVYDYEECKITKESWPLYTQLIEQRADIDYLTMITE